MGESGFLIFDLIGNAVYFDVARFGKWNVVFFPFLPETFGDEFFKNFTCVVLAVGDFGVEEIGRAEDFGLRKKHNLLCVVWFEPEGVSVATACVVEAENVWKDFRGGDRLVNRALVLETENVVMSVRKAVVTGNEVVENRGVRHWWGLLFFCYTHYKPWVGICQALFSQLLKFFS